MRMCVENAWFFILECLSKDVFICYIWMETTDIANVLQSLCAIILLLVSLVFAENSP